MRIFVKGPHHDVYQAEERRCFHRVLKKRQFRVRAPFEDVRDILPVVLLVDLQGTGGLLPPEDEGVQFHSSHTIHLHNHRHDPDIKELPAGRESAGDGGFLPVTSRQ